MENISAELNRGVWRKSKLKNRILNSLSPQTSESSFYFSVNITKSLFSLTDTFLLAVVFKWEARNRKRRLRLLRLQLSLLGLWSLIFRAKTMMHLPLSTYWKTVLPTISVFFFAFSSSGFLCSGRQCLWFSQIFSVSTQFPQISEGFPC